MSVRRLACCALGCCAIGGVLPACGGAGWGADAVRDGRPPPAGRYAIARVDERGGETVYLRAELELAADGTARLCAATTQPIDDVEHVVLRTVRVSGRGTWTRGPAAVTLTLDDDPGACAGSVYAEHRAPPHAVDCAAVDHALGVVVACRGHGTSDRLPITTPGLVAHDDALVLRAPALFLEGDDHAHPRERDADPVPGEAGSLAPPAISP